MYRKRRAKDIGQASAQEPAQGSEAAASLPQRIGESASALLKESFELSSPRTFTGVLASINNNIKAGSSSSSEDTEESSLAFRSSPQYEETAPDQCESFRSNERDGKLGRTYGQVAFDKFVASPNQLGHDPDPITDWPGLIGDKQGSCTVGAAEDDLHQIQERGAWRTQDKYQGITDQNIDGAAVVALLSDPAFTVDEEPSSTLDSETDGAEGRYHKGLRTGERLAESIGVLHPSSPLDLVPDFGARWDLSHTLSATPTGIYESRHFLELGSRETQPWIDILGRYHDEVWAEISPLVQEAREELEAANEKQTCLQEGPAIRRLMMVLQHLRNPNNG